MATIKVYTDDGCLVDSLDVNDDQIVGSGRLIFGHAATPMGWLGRTLSDARIIQRGGDPELPSEKVMRMLAERGQA